MAGKEDFSLLAIAIVIIGLRIYARWTQVGFARGQLDDYLMPLMAAAFTVATVTAYFEGRHGLTNAAMTDAERVAIDFHSREYRYRRGGSKGQVLLWCLYVFILWGLKLCVTVLCSRLTWVFAGPLPFEWVLHINRDTTRAGLPYLRYRIRFAYILIGTTYLGVTLTMLLSCRPLPRFWQIKINPGNSCQPAVSRIFVFVVLIPNIVTDLYLLSIPLPGGPDVVVRGSLWACREAFVAIIVTNLPILQPLFKRCAERLGMNSVGVSRTSSSRSGSRSSHFLRTLCSNWHLSEQPLKNNTSQSTERILPDSEVQRQSGTASTLPANGIVVDQEIHITMELAPAARIKDSGMDSPRDANDVARDLNSIRSSRPLAPRTSTRIVRIGSAIQIMR
ncbi:hypothetical protein K449DRAFT_434998 [Hypoxylon sp. EC38]|nr:hypothetical protein K449DRAFT_434998 [Hypoxylon sp. EC38]